MDNRRLFYTSKSQNNKKTYISNKKIEEKENNKIFEDIFSQLENLRKKKEQELNNYVIRS